MDNLFLSTTAQRGESKRLDKRITISLSKKTLFGNKQSDEWHQQIDFTAGILRPSDQRFPWLLAKKHTDHYIKKKGKLTQQEVDIRLCILIESHEARDVAIAACGHAMSPTAIRALLNVELNVTPVTYYGLEMYFQSLIAANYSNPKSVTDLEAWWATRLLPYATHGSGAAGTYLEGLCDILRTSNVPNMNVLPDFSILARRAFKDFASQLEGYKLKNQWVTARSVVAWMSMLAKTSSAARPPGHLLPEHVMDAQFPIWRIWASWRPNLERIKMLNGLDSHKRGVLPDMLALEGPDFITGTHATLRNGVIAQYGAAKPLVRFRSLLIEVTSCTKDELRDMLLQLVTALETALVIGGGAFKLFVQLTIARPITKIALQLLQAISKISDTPKFHVHNAVLEIWPAQPTIGGKHILALSHLICALDDEGGEDLRKVLLRPWLIQGLEKCIKDCQGAVRTHIETGLKWTHLAQEFHTFCSIVKGSEHCLSLLDPMFQRQLDVLPSSATLRAVLDVYHVAGGEKVFDTLPGGNALKDAIEAFCIDTLMERGTMSHASRRTVDAIVTIWKDTKSAERRRLAIMACKHAGLDFNLRCRCLAQVTFMSDEQVTEFVGIMDGLATNGGEICIKFTRLLAKCDEVEVVQCWKGILYSLIERESKAGPATIINYTLDKFKSWEWFQWMLDLNTVFADVIMNPKAAPPLILQLHLHLWVQQLSEFIPTITRLEEFYGKSVHAIHCILKGGEGLWVEYLVRLLDALTKAQEQPVEKLMQTVTGKLTVEGNNAAEVSQCVCSLLATTEEGAEACQRVWNSFHDESIPSVVNEVVVAGWLQEEEATDNGQEGLTNCDKSAIKAVANLLNIRIFEDGVPDDILTEAMKYYQEEEAKILKEADRLDGIKQALKSRDPRGTAILLQQLGIPDISRLDEELESLPLGVADAVEKRRDNEIEISFPLASFTELERTAMGIGTARNLLIRLYLDYMSDMPPSFCIHLDDDTEISDLSTIHTPWVCFEDSGEPQWPYCRRKDTPLTWQLNRILHRHIKLIDEIGIAGLHDLIKKRLEQSADCCIVCGAIHNSGNSRLRRSTSCQQTSCANIWNNMPLELRVPEIRTDPFAVDMLLTGVYAAAMSGRTELLPGCPIKSTQGVITVLNSLPSLAMMDIFTDVSRHLKSYHKDAEKLVTWACTHYRGFVASATGICRIPTLPTGTHQFILANASPTLEKDFASRLPRLNPQTRVLFHGTSLDRLPAILAQGLKIQSGTSLQRTGAAHGKGIYMAEDPATSFSYSPSAVSWRGSGLNNMRLLLGCEVVGTGNPVSGGIHVIKDEKTVMVRYVFLLTNSAYAPNAGHITPPMLSAMNALRSGSI